MYQCPSQLQAQVQLRPGPVKGVTQVSLHHHSVAKKTVEQVYRLPTNQNKSLLKAILQLQPDKGRDYKEGNLQPEAIQGKDPPQAKINSIIRQFLALIMADGHRESSIPWEGQCHTNSTTQDC